RLAASATTNAPPARSRTVPRLPERAILREPRFRRPAPSGMPYSAAIWSIFLVGRHCPDSAGLLHGVTGSRGLRWVSAQSLGPAAGPAFRVSARPGGAR